MSMTPRDVNPFNWSTNVKTFAGLLAILGTMVASSRYLGEVIYHVAEIQTFMNENIKASQRDIIALQARLVEESEKRDKALERIKDSVDKDHVEVEAVKTAASVAASEASNAKLRIQELTEDVKNVARTVTDILAATRGHDEDIRVTREAVAPKKASPFGR